MTTGSRLLTAVRAKSMTRIGIGMTSTQQAVLRRVALTAVLAAGHATVRLGNPARRAKRRCWRAQPAVPMWAAALVALAGPAVAVLPAALRPDTQWRPPPSLPGKLLLAGYVLTGVAAEELIWRAPLTYPSSRRTRCALAAVGTAGFVAAHVPRDRRTACAHAVNGISWAAAALLGRRLVWPGLGHALYNYTAFALTAKAVA